MPESKPHSSPFHTQRLAMIYALVVMHHKRYDPWGVRKDPITWKTDFSAGGSITARGYTMHEHLDDFGLINMNGRIYDPLLGRFLSPDNNIQAPGNPQNYNRYSYALNNPLVYTDPDGEIIVPIMIGAGISVLTNGITNSIHDKPFFKGAGKAAVIGGLGGAFSFGIGQAAVGMSGFGKTAFQTLAHGHLGGMMSQANGGSYGQGMLSGALGSLTATGMGSMFSDASKGVQALGAIGGGSLAGGIGAEIAGGNFWDGARNGAISAGLNHAYHSSLKQKIFIDNYDETLDFAKYRNLLEKNLEANNFSSRLEVKEYAWSKYIWASLKGNPTALVSVRDFYARGAPLDGNILGYARMGSNSAIVYGKTRILGRNNNPSISDLVNVTTHELGHGLFSFGHSSEGIMYKYYQAGSPLKTFNFSQLLTISNSIWGESF